MALADDLSHIGAARGSRLHSVCRQRRRPAPQIQPDGGLAGITSSAMFRSAGSKGTDMAKNFIINTLKTFSGPLTHLTIVEQAFAAKNLGTA